MVQQQQVKVIFDEALEIADPTKRHAYLDTACANAPEVRRQVEALLQAYVEAGSFLEKPVDVQATVNERPTNGLNQSDVATVPPPGDATNQRTLPPTGATAADLAPAQTNVPGFEILGELGRGGMGVVYKARQTKLNRIVALKMILAGGHAGAAQFERFRTEAEAIARLQHPNIVQIHEVGEHDGLPFFALEFCAGGSLEKKLAGTPLPAREAAALVETLARAMHAVHEKDVIHRDLKPANVLLAEDGSPKITDFGLAKKLEDVGQTATGAIMGTPSYMAPEQAEGGAKELGPACDIYALGVILYECLTGRPPFRAATPLDTLMQVVADEPVPPSQLNPKTPRDLETICLQCLHKEPAKRYATGEDLAADLRRYRAGEPIKARPVGQLERALKWVRRRPAVASLLALAVFLILVGVGGIAWQWREAEHARAQALQKADDEEKARAKAEQAQKAEGAARRKAEYLLAENYLNRGYALCEQGENHAGFLWMGRSLERAPRDAHELQRLIRINLSAWRPNLIPLQSAFDCQKHGESIALSPDGSKIAIWAGEDVRLWDGATGKPIGKPLTHPEEASSSNTKFLGFSPNGEVLLTGSGAGLWRWDTASGMPIGQPTVARGNFYACAFSVDTRTIFAITEGQDQFLLGRWNAVTGESVDKLVPLGMPKGRWNVRAWKPFAISPDQKTVLISHGEVTWIVDSTTGKRIGEPLEHHKESMVSCAAFSPDGKTVVTGAGLSVWFWDAATAKPKGTSHRHELDLKETEGVLAVAFCNGGSRIVVGCGDGSARFLDATTGKAVAQPLQHRATVWAVACSLHSGKILTASSTEARLWEVARPDAGAVVLPHRAPVRGIAWSYDGKRLLSGSGDTGVASWGEAQLWDATTGSPIGKPMPHQRAVFEVAFSPEGKTLLTRERPLDMNEKAAVIARLWDATTGKPIGDPIQPSYLWKATFSPEGRTILTWGGDNRFRLWDAVTGKLRVQLDEVSSTQAAAFSPNEKLIVTIGATLKKSDNSLDYYDLRLWDTITGKPIGQPVKLKASTWHVTFSPDGKRLLTGSEDKTAQQWDGATLKVISSPLQHKGPVHLVAFSHDSNFILTASGTVIRLWDTTTQAPIGQPIEHRGRVEEGLFSPDGTVIATRSANGTARLWDTTTGQPIGPPVHQYASVTAMAFSPDGERFITASDKNARIWKLPTPMGGEPERVALWTQVVTGMELDEHGAVSLLDAKTWEERRKRLEELGGAAK